MFTTSVLDSLATFGYFVAFAGLLCCVLAYFVLPAIIRNSIGGDDKNEDK